MSPPSCSACLGTRRCWVCEGSGRVETAPDYIRPCPRCGGTGVCTVCRGENNVQIPQPRGEIDVGATVEVEGDHVRIRAYGEFDIDSASTLAAALEDATGSGVSVVLDLAATTFIDLFALRHVIAAADRLNADGRTLKVINAMPLVARLFQVTDLTDLLTA